MPCARRPCGAWRLLRGLDRRCPPARGVHGTTHTAPAQGRPSARASLHQAAAEPTEERLHPIDQDRMVVPLVAARRALAARLAAGAYVGPVFSSFSSTPIVTPPRSTSDEPDLASPLHSSFLTASPATPALARELRFACQRATLAVRQARRLIHAGAVEVGLPNGRGGASEARGGSGGDGRGRSSRGDADARYETWQAFFSPGEERSSRARAFNGHDRVYALDEGAADVLGVAGGLTRSGPDAVAVVRWCAGELERLVELVEAAAAAREAARGGAAPLGESDASVTRAPVELRESAVQGPTGASAPPMTPSVFADPLAGVDVVEAAARAQSLLGELLHTLVEDLLVMDTAADAMGDELALAAVAYRLVSRVAEMVETVVVRRVLPAVVKAERRHLASLAARGADAVSTLAMSPPMCEGGAVGVGVGPATPSSVPPPSSPSSAVAEAAGWWGEPPSLMAQILHTCTRDLPVTDEVLLLVVCSQRESPSGALVLVDRLCEVNRALAAAAVVVGSHSRTDVTGTACGAVGEGEEAVAVRDLPSLSARVAARVSYDVGRTLALVLAQHGAWAPCLLMLCPDDKATHDGRALAKLLLAIALANASSADPVPPLLASTSPTPAAALLLASLAADLSPACAAGELSSRRPPLSGGIPRPALLAHLLSHGIAPARPLSVAEYGALLKHMLRHPRSPASSSPPLGHPIHRPDPSDVRWVLSPSAVWRHFAGFPHHTRATLCLVGFQTLARHGLAGSMGMEDLLVVLSLTRQARRARARALRLRRSWLLTRAGAPEGVRGGGLHAANHSTKGMVDGAVAEVVAEESVSALCGAFPPLLLPAMRRTPPAGPEHLVALCEAYTAVRQRASSYPLRTPLCPAPAPAPPPPLAGTTIPARGPAGRAGGSMTAQTVAGPPLHGGSTVVLSVASRELLALWEDAGLTTAAPLVGEAVLAAVSTVIAHEGLRPDTARVLEDLARALARTVDELAIAGGGAAQATVHGSSLRDSGRHPSTHLGVTASAIATTATTTTPTLTGPATAAGEVGRSLDMLVRLAPYVSAFTVALAAQSQAGRLFSWQQCLQLAPYTPLGSRGQMRLLRRVAEEGARDGKVGARLRALLRRGAIPTAPLARSREGGRAPTPGPPSLVPRRRASPTATDEQLTLTLLLEPHWPRALATFQAAPPRVRVAGARHLVRLVMEADAWREVGEEQLRPMVRLAVRATGQRGGVGTFTSSPTSRSAAAAAADPSGCDGVRGGDAQSDSFAEEVLRTALAHGMWATGLRFHQLATEERPDLLQSSPRAQAYASMLWKGLVERTVLARTIADVAKASRAGQWAQASAHFLLYATECDWPTGVRREGGRVSDGEGQGGRTYPTLSVRMAHHVLDTTMAALQARAESARGEAADSTGGVGAVQAFVEGPLARAMAPALRGAAHSGGHHHGPHRDVMPAGLATFAQTVRYALLRTPQTRDFAFRWFPATTLPVPATLRAELEAAHGRDFLLSNGMVAVSDVDGSESGAMKDSSSSGDTLADSTAGHAGEPTAACVAPSSLPAATLAGPPPPPPPPPALHSLVEAARRDSGRLVGLRGRTATAGTHEDIVRAALEVYRARGAWAASLQLYDYAVREGCLPYQACATVLRTTLAGGAPWWVTLRYFSHMSRRLRPDVPSTTAALEACVVGAQWELALRVLRQSALTTTHPAPKVVELAVRTSLSCGQWSHALQTAHAYRATRSPQLAHTILHTYAATEHWDDVVDYFYYCTLRGVRPLDASIELALVAAEAASAEYRRTALLVGSIASALEDLYTISGAVLEHVTFVHRHWQRRGLPRVGHGRPPFAREGGAWSISRATLALPEGALGEGHDAFAALELGGGTVYTVLAAPPLPAWSARCDPEPAVAPLWNRSGGVCSTVERVGFVSDADVACAAAWTPLLLHDPPYWEAFTAGPPVWAPVSP